MNKEQNGKNATREQARQILKDGILNMNIGRLIQMSNYGLMGSVILLNEKMFIQNVFNHIDYEEENKIIMFSVKESEDSYGMVSFSVDAITEISGCEDEENPEEYLNVNIKLQDGMTVHIRILY